MKKYNAKEIIFVIVIAIILVFSITTISYAFFFKKTPVDMNLQSGDICAEFSDITLSGSTIFQNKGDKYIADFDVANTGNVPFSYTIDLFLTKGGLEGATLLYFDNEFLGTLSQYFGNDTTKTIIIDTPLYNNESFSHEIKLEYHIGSGSYYSLDSKDFDLTVSATAQQLFPTSMKMFVGSFYELKQIVENYDYTSFTLQLTDDLEFDENIEFDKPISINLAGNTINLNSYSITYNYGNNSNSRIYSSRDIADQYGIYGGGININTPNGIVSNEIDFDDDIYSFNITSCSSTVFIDMYKNYLDVLLKYGINETGIDFESNYSEYISLFNMNFSSSDIMLVANDYTITIPDFTKTIELSFDFPSLVETLSYDVDVWGNREDSIINSIIQNNFYFLKGNYEPDYVSYISGDILLPTRDRLHNVEIEWISGNRDILDENGIFYAPNQDTPMEISAVFSINGINILKTFPIIAESKSKEERLREICLLHGQIAFVQYDQEQNLPKEEDYSYMGIDTFSFSLPQSVQSIFVINDVNNTLTIVTDTDIESTFINIDATFDGETEVISDTIDIKINILRNISYWDSAYNLIMTKVSQVEENTLEGFELPNNYKTSTTIEYFVIPGEIDEYTNPADIQEYISINQDNTAIILDKNKLPQENTTVAIKAEITFDGIMEERYFTFSVGGILHYSEEDIEDINLFQELRKVYDTNGDQYITRDEIDETILLEPLNFSTHNIASIKGIEFFDDIDSIDLSNNDIIDLSPLENLYSLTQLNLANNEILDVSSLSNLTSLESLYLSNNGLQDISSLRSLTNLNLLYLDNNAFLSDLSVIENFPELIYLTSYNTQAVTDDDAKNENVFITAYQNAYNFYDQTNQTDYYRYSSGTQWTPSATQITANTIINNIVPIYEFSNVIYLPYTITYNGTDYDVSWASTNDDIINIAEERAYITQPISDIDVRLNATIEYSSYTLSKFFNVISRKEDELPLYVYNGTTLVDAENAISDSHLRYHLFDIFNTNNDNTIDSNEINTSHGDIDLSGKDIGNIQGIQYFANAISVLDLRNNNIADLSQLQYMTNLNTLYLNNNSTNFSTLTALSNLTILSVYGLENINSDANLEILYNMYKNNSGITIYKDSLNEVWDPYIKPMTKALTNLEGIYLLPIGSENDIVLQSTVDVTMYDDSIESMNISYSKNTGKFSLIDSNTTLHLYYDDYEARDNYGILNASITYSTTTVTRYLTVISVAETNLYIEVSSGVYELLCDAVPNERARFMFIDRLSSSTPASTTINPTTEETISYISISQYIGMTYIRFDGVEEYGLKGIELFKGSTNLNEIQIYGYLSEESSSYYDNYIGLSELTSADYPALTSIAYYYSIADFFELINLTSLTKLKAYRCPKVVMDRKQTGQSRESIFSTLTNLTELYLNNNSIRDFWAIKYLEKVVNMDIYGNDVSESDVTNIYVEQAYAHLSYGTSIIYQIIDVNVFWESSQDALDDLGVTINTTINAKPTAYNVNYINIGDTITVPLRYKSDTNNVVWATQRGRNIYTYNEGSTTATYTFSAPIVKAYISIVATVSDFKTLEYVFVLNSSNSNSSYLDLNDFMTNGVFEDNYFTHYLFTQIVDEDNGNGVFSMATVQSVSSIDDNATTNNSAIYNYNSIKGIKNFTGLTLIRLNNHSIDDISELYYCENLITLKMYGNQIDSLMNTAEGKSIFYNMQNLQTIYLYNNAGIEDFYPIVERNDTSDLFNLDAMLLYPGSTTYFPAVEDEDSDKNRNIFDMAKVWWNIRKNETSVNPVLQIDGGQKYDTYDEVNDAINCMYALDSIVGRTDVTTGTSLGSSVTIDIDSVPTIFPIYWTNYGDDNIISVTNAGIIDSINAEIGFTNHTVKMRVYTYPDGMTVPISKFVNIRLDIETNIDDDDLRIEITNAEKNLRFSALNPVLVYDDANDANDIYTVAAKDVIPDNNLRNYLFYRKDITPYGTMSLSERNNTISYFDAGERAIYDITGMDLFPNIKRWIFTENMITEIPEFYIEAGSTVYELTLYRNYQFKNIDNIDFDGDGAGSDYVSLASKLTYIDFREVGEIQEEQFENNIGSCTNLDKMYLNAAKISDYSAIQVLYNSITNIWTNNYRVYANHNFNKIKKLILDSYSGVFYTSGIDGFTNILSSLVEMEMQYEADGITSYTLPSTFKANDYDKDYGLIWEVPDGTTAYTITENAGIYSLVISTDADAIINIIATVTYEENGIKTTYSETFSLITSQEADLSNLYYTTEGTIWSRFTEEYVNIEDVMPDTTLRYYFYHSLDDNGDEILSESELSEDSVVFDNGYYYINDLEGIQYLIGTTSLTLRRYMNYDLSPLANLPSLEYLYLYNLQKLIRDCSFIDNLANLQTINFNDSGFQNFSFITNNDNVVELLNINDSQSLTRFAMYNRNFWAYSRMFNNFSDDGTIMGDEILFENTEDEKYASAILNEISFDFETNSITKINNTTNSLILPTNVTYKGTSYPIDWIRMSRNIEIISNTMTINDDSYENEYYFIARVPFNNGKYERMFSIKYYDAG